MKNYALHTPAGVKDYLWEEAFQKDEIQNKIKVLLSSYSYQLIETPTFEYLDVFTLGEHSYQNPSLYKWMNKEGELVALRSDMTRAIARVVATQNSTKLFPQRYAYVANSFRYPERYQGKLHEFTQAGIELIGSKNLEADAEVIRLAIEAVEVAGIEDFKIHIGSAKFLNVLLEDMGLDEEQKNSIYAAIERKDAVTIQSLLNEELVYFMQRVGGIDLVKKLKEQKLPASAYEALEELEQLYALLEDYGVSQFVLFDFSLLSYGSYYTGVMFQGYTQGIGSALVEGGRYDKLLSAFGSDEPAVGMGLHINLLLQKLNQVKPAMTMGRTLFVAEPGMRQMAFKIGQQFRSEGLVVEQYLGSSIEEAVDYAKKALIGGIVYFKGEEDIELYHLEEGSKQNITLAALLGGEE